MKTQHAVRNIRLCSKDCLCLYVCPVGASDTENGQIDFAKCTGCGACAAACPSGAISMVPLQLPAQQSKMRSVSEGLRKIIKSKAEQEEIAKSIKENAANPIERKLAAAVEKSTRLMSEDLFRESGFMLPQSNNARTALLFALENTDSDFPKDSVEKLLSMLKVND